MGTSIGGSGLDPSRGVPVDSAAPNIGDILIWDGVDWTPGALPEPLESERFLNFTLGSAPTYTTLKTWTLVDGEAFAATLFMAIARGSGLSRTMRGNEGMTIAASKPTGGTVIINNFATGTSFGSNPVVQITLVVSTPNTIALQLRQAGGGTADVELFYTKSSLVRL